MIPKGPSHTGQPVHGSHWWGDRTRIRLLCLSHFGERSLSASGKKEYSTLSREESLLPKVIASPEMDPPFLPPQKQRLMSCLHCRPGFPRAHQYAKAAAFLRNRSFPHTHLSSGVICSGKPCARPSASFLHCSLCHFIFVKSKDEHRGTNLGFLRGEMGLSDLNRGLPVARQSPERSIVSNEGSIHGLSEPSSVQLN